jgi:hypothetical protein
MALLSMSSSGCGGDEYGGGSGGSGSSGGGVSGAGRDKNTGAGAEEKEDGEREEVVERDGVVQRFHRKCILKCSSCTQPISRKRGKIYKKQVTCLLFVVCWCLVFL